jgi:hypothetical protein
MEPLTRGDARRPASAGATVISRQAAKSANPNRGARGIRAPDLFLFGFSYVVLLFAI